MQPILNWLNGLKTVLGLAMLQLANAVPAGTVMMGPVDFHAVLAWLGGILTTVGVLHKIGKTNTSPEATK